MGVISNFREDHWGPICRRLIEAGHNGVPNGRMVDSFLKDSKLFYVVEFDTEQDQLMFALSWV